MGVERPETLPVDGAFGRLIGSKTATSVSVTSITWDKLTDKEYTRFNDHTCGGGDAHGKTLQIAPGDVADLIAFLESL